MPTTLTPAEVFAPGEYLRDELEARGWTGEEFAEIIGRPVQVVSEILNGRKQIVPETALAIADALGTSAELWVNLQTAYNLHEAKAVRPASSDVARRSVGGIFDLLAPLNDKTQKLSALVSENGRLLHSWFLSRMLFVPAKRGQLFPTADAESIARAEVPLRQALSACHSLDAVNQVSYLESRCYMLNTLLRDSDSMSMAHGFELRVPFLDPDLVRKVFSLPGGSKRAQNCPKPLLVRALTNALPKSIVHRRKQGFTLPFEHWMRDEMRVPIEAGLTGSSSGPLASVLNPHAVGEVWSQFMAGQTSWSRPWALHVLDRWCAKNL